MIIVHCSQIPWFWQDEKGPYIIEDDVRRDLPLGTTRDQILWFQKPYPGGKNEAFKRDLEWDINGSNGKKYKVSLYDDSWSCNCHSFKFSGNKRSCKHIEDIKGSYLS
jgi:hypothetical protein